MVDPVGFRSRNEKVAHFVFTLPIFNVIWIASTTDVNISPRLYQHVVSGDDIGDGRQFWIIPRDPESYGNII